VLQYSLAVGNRDCGVCISSFKKTFLWPQNVVNFVGSQSIQNSATKQQQQQMMNDGNPNTL